MGRDGPPASFPIKNGKDLSSLLTYIEYRYTMTMTIFDIVAGGEGMARKKLDTLTEQMYYVLLSLTKERHGYGIMQYVSELTGGRVAIGAGTLYALLARFEKEGLIRLSAEEENRKRYRLTDEGRKVLEEEFDRLRRQVADGERVLREEDGHENG